MFNTLYQPQSHHVDWEKVIGPMKLSVTLYVPGLPEKYTPFLAAGIVIAMLVGLNLRHVLPTFSAFAWGTASAFVVSLFVQVIGLSIAQALKIVEKEKIYGGRIRFASSAS